MAVCIAQLALNFHPTHPIKVTFDAPHISSDGGVLLLRQMDDRLGLSERLAALLPDARDPRKVQHDRREQMRQRLYQIALGYPDCNDADRLRQDPVLKSACDRSPQAEGLSSQPTLSRLENAVNIGKLRALVCEIEEQYVRSFSEAPEVIILDIDSTDDPTHGQQQLSFFHGYYDQHMYHPLVIFDGERGQLVSVVLRPGNAHAARVARLEDLEAIRQTWLDYCMRLDSADWTALGDVFTEDAVLEMNGLEHLVKGLDGQYRGRHAIINDFYRQTGALLPLGAKSMFVTGHLSTNMQIKLEGDEATTLAYFFEIVANDRVLIGTYQHRLRRGADRWRFRFLRISIRYRAKLEASDVGGQSLNDILARPV